MVNEIVSKHVRIMTNEIICNSYKGLLLYVPTLLEIHMYLWM